MVWQRTLKYKRLTPHTRRNGDKVQRRYCITVIADEYRCRYTITGRIFKANWCRNPVIRIIEI